ncbi:ubiquitin carboxyl-terminal hydrolase 37-like isoform X2 [Salmo trutta]|uniref:ubiquitin carboxyl-terminal hydrolase 37-like isoform X2 n=1 Tax=Salmo trutta TaxID=8032 RepID=UPI00113206B9|nr:ubiquitin carboxyl-terminal hydrolase 37-like isoform X2 [Salmo trutta]
MHGKKKCRVRLGIGSRCPSPFPIPPKLTSLDASMVTASVWKNREKKNVKDHHQLDSSFVSSFHLKPSTTSLTPLDPLSGRTPIGTASPSPPGSPARSPSTLSKFFSLSSLSSLHLSSVSSSSSEEGSQTSSPFSASSVSLAVSTQSSSSATPPSPACPSSTTHVSSPAPQSSSPNPLDHRGETNKDSETARDLISSEVKEMGAVVPQTKRTVPRFAGIAEASIDLRDSSVSLERPLVRPREAMARLPNLFSKSSTQLGEQSCTGEGEDNTKLLGLPNIGNTCFMNSALQCLLGLPAFCRDILRQQDTWSSSPSSKLLCCFAELHQARLSGGTINAKKKMKILQTVKRCLSVVNEDYEDDGEQDAHECVLLLLFQLKEEGMALKGSPEPYTCPVKQLEFKLKTFRTCTSCGVIVYGQEDYNHLSLNLSQDLTHSLDLYFKPSALECACRVCSGSMASVTRHFLTLPRVLMLHIKRFTAGNWEPEKVDDPISIPAELTLPAVCGATAPVQHGARASSMGKNNMDNTPANSPKGTLDRPASNSSDQLEKPADSEKEQQAAAVRHQPDNIYKLSSVISHLGDNMCTGKMHARTHNSESLMYTLFCFPCSLGHYISDVLDSRGSGWLCLDDAHVLRTDEATVLRATAQTAYILFYVCSGPGEGDQAPHY